jgi:hypothetical protein
MSSPPLRTPAPCGRLAAVSLLTELDAFYLDHRRCGELEAGVDERAVWIACDSGATVTPGGCSVLEMVRHVSDDDVLVE